MPEAEDTDVRIGQLAYRAGFVTESDLEDALLEQERRSGDGFLTKLGELMVSMGFITQRQLDRLLASQAVVHANVSRIGPYSLIAKLGEGGMGAVYQARDVRTAELVALKILPRSKARDRSFLARFEQEARAVFELDHPNVVRAVGMGEADGYHYLAMEYVDGRDVYDILEEKGRIPELDALSIVIQITQALEHAAEEQVVHRDIKPGNILVDRHGLAKLTDFGLALDLDRMGRGRITEGGEALGTPFYLSPELARFEHDVDVRSDIYSLGATLYEMVTGHPPFEGPAVVVMSKHLSEQIPSPWDFDRTLSRGICLVIQKMMAKRREDRYQTPRELLRDLMLVYQGSEPLSAGLPSHKSSVRTRIRPARRRAGGGAVRRHAARLSSPKSGEAGLRAKRPRQKEIKKADGRASRETEKVPPPAGARGPVDEAEGSGETGLRRLPVAIPHRTTILIAVAAALVTALAVHLAIVLSPGRGSTELAEVREPSDGNAAHAPPLAPSSKAGLILRADFESGTTEGWRGEILTQGAGDGAYGLRVPAALPPDRGLATGASGVSIPSGGAPRVAFLYYFDGPGPIVVEVHDPTSGARLRAAIEEPARNTWAAASVVGEMFRLAPDARPDAGEADDGEGPARTLSIAAPEAGPLDTLALDSIRVWSE